MNILPIKTEADYRDTLREIETLMSAEAGSAAGDRLDVLATLVESYERTHFPMDLPDAVRPSSSGWNSRASRSTI
jgi:Predicted transcription regulator containing HTH domain